MLKLLFSLPFLFHHETPHPLPTLLIFIASIHDCCVTQYRKPYRSQTLISHLSTNLGSFGTLGKLEVQGIQCQDHDISRPDTLFHQPSPYLYVLVGMQYDLVSSWYVEGPGIQFFFSI